MSKTPIRGLRLQAAERLPHPEGAPVLRERRSFFASANSRFFASAPHPGFGSNPKYVSWDAVLAAVN